MALVITVANENISFEKSQLSNEFFMVLLALFYRSIYCQNQLKIGYQIVKLPICPLKNIYFI